MPKRRGSSRKLGNDRGRGTFEWADRLDTWLWEFVESRERAARAETEVAFLRAQMRAAQDALGQAAVDVAAAVMLARTEPGHEQKSNQASGVKPKAWSKRDSKKRRAKARGR